MKLTGANMMVNKIVLSICAGLICSIVYSESNILWDFGVIIKLNDHHYKSKDNPLQNPNKPNEYKVKRNAVISDPFLPPVLSSVPLQESSQINHVSNGLTLLDSERNIFQISNEAKRFFLKKKYKRVIELINHTVLSGLSCQKRHDLEYLLIHALYQTGDYHKARDQVLSSLEHNETGELYFLLAIIYDAIGQTNVARKYYLKLINQYPESDYIASANIKIRILDQH